MPNLTDLLDSEFAKHTTNPSQIQKILDGLAALQADVNAIADFLGLPSVPPAVNAADQAALDAIAKESSDLLTQAQSISTEPPQP